MKSSDLLTAATAAALAFWLIRTWEAAKQRTAAAATRYSVDAGSDQAAMLAAQDRGFYD